MSQKNIKPKFTHDYDLTLYKEFSDLFSDLRIKFILKSGNSKEYYSLLRKHKILLKKLAKRLNILTLDKYKLIKKEFDDK